MIAVGQIVCYHKFIMTDVARILNQIEDGDPSAANALFALVYDDLHKLAAAKMVHEAPGQTLLTTGLVQEADMRLVDNEKALQWDSCDHFFAAVVGAGAITR